MLIYASSLKHKASKIHWSSMDGITSSSCQVSTTSDPHKLPYQKPNPSRQSQRRISNIDIHKNMGFRTLEHLKYFQQVSQNNVTFINAGEIPTNIGNYTTIKKHTHNKNTVPRSHHFFNVAHMDVAYVIG